MSAHLLIRDSQQPFGNMVPVGYDDELLLLAHDLANRLLCAFDNTSLGIPYPRVTLPTGSYLSLTNDLLMLFPCLMSGQS